METPRGAILQRDKETYAIVAKMPMGLVDADTLIKIGELAKKHHIPILKIVSGQRMALIGLKPEQVEPVWQEIGLEPGKAVELCLHYVQSCPGTTVCKFGQQDSLAIAAKLEHILSGLELPAKAKIGVSGCLNNCGEGKVRDFGLFGKREGWSVFFGGSSGRQPRAGDLLSEGLPDKDVLDLAMKCFTVYKDHAKPRERTARFIERFGIEEFKKLVLGR